jgi:hypothetical protein
MMLLKNFLIIIIFAQKFYASDNWAAAHVTLIDASWRKFFLEALRKMESPASTPEERVDVFKQYTSGRWAGLPTGIAVTDLTSYLDHKPFNLAKVLELVEAGFIPVPNEKFKHYKDRRFTAGWQLDTINLIRQQEKTAALLTEASDVKTSDLAKINALSGTFWMRNERGQFRESFSGMILPGQFLGDTIDVVTCFHGLWHNKLDQIYFLPKGMRPKTENFFQVVDVRVGQDNSFMDQDAVDLLSARWNQDDWGTVFNQNDYVVAKISNQSADGKALSDILNAKHIVSSGRVLDLLGNTLPAFGSPFVIAFGKPGDSFIRGNTHSVLDGFCLAVNDEPFKLEITSLVHPVRRDLVQADSGLTAATLFSKLDSKIAVSIPLAPGMSGGPVFLCEKNARTNHQVYCRLIGTVHGSNLVTYQGAEISFKGLIAIP